VTTYRNGHFTGAMAAMVDRQARERIQALEERAVRRDREVAELSSTVSRLKATVEAIRGSIPLPSPAIPSNLPTRATSIPTIRLPIAPSAAAAPDCHRPVRPLLQTLPRATSALALPAAPAGFASLIIADFPALFAEFGGKRFTLLWRGSSDGFGAGNFHGRCDGHAPTLTLIQDTKGSIFGGFTPAEWESPASWKRKADPSLKSFLFTLKNSKCSEKAKDQLHHNLGQARLRNKRLQQSILSEHFPGEEICAEGPREGQSNLL
jgi:hypothetical protein